MFPSNFIADLVYYIASTEEKLSCPDTCSQTEFRGGGTWEAASFSLKISPLHIQKMNLCPRTYSIKNGLSDKLL